MKADVHQWALRVFPKTVLEPESSSLTTGSVTSGEVTTLGHEARDDTVEGGALEVKGDTLSANTLLASAESLEVPGSLGDNVVIESELDATSLVSLRLS